MADSSHISRWQVALILLPMIGLIIFLRQPLLFNIAVVGAGCLALNEFYRLRFAETKQVVKILGCLGLALVVFASKNGPGLNQLGSFALAISVGLVYFLFVFSPSEEQLDNLSWFALGHVYISLSLSFFAALYSLKDGYLLILSAMLITFLADTGAFYTGRTFGKRPLYKAVSPNKTLEGLAGSIIAGGAASTVLMLILLPGRISVLEAFLLGAALGLWGAVGDLFESMLKRSVKVKDSGTLLKGHGGMLDRIDALLFNVPFVYFYAAFRLDLVN